MFRSAGARRDFFRLARSINISLRWSEGKAKSGRKRPFLTCQVLKLGRCYQRKGCYLVLPDHQAKAAVLMKSLRATLKDNASSVVSPGTTTTIPTSRAFHFSETKLHCELNQSRIVAGGSDAAKISGVNDLSGVLSNAATG